MNANKCVGQQYLSVYIYMRVLLVQYADGVTA